MLRKLPAPILRFMSSMRSVRARVSRMLRRSVQLIRQISLILGAFSIAAAVVCVVCMVIHVGYEHTAEGYSTMRHIMRLVQIVFLTNVIFNLTFNLAETLRESRPLQWVVNIGLLLSLLPSIYPRPEHPWIEWLDHIIYSSNFLYGILTVYAVFLLFYALFRLVDRRTNPSLLLSLSFAVFIIIGTFMLMLPKATFNGISFVDAFFVSTSAVCVTGLTPVDVPTTFTPLGLAILATLIQFGALGVMTFTSFFALFFSGTASIFSQLMLRDVIYSKTMNALIPTLLYILGFTLSIETVGAALILWSVHGTLGMSLENEIVFACFHSLSAFCNAGFSTLPDGLSNPMLLGHNNSIYWIMSMLIIAGATGFPILVNAKDAAVEILTRKWQKLKHRPTQQRTVHPFDMNTKIVLFTFSILFIAGTLLFFILEYTNSLGGMDLWSKITQSAFNSAVPRSAGFASVNPAGFLNVTLVMIMFLMWVGGGSQSTGGGIKVNTLAAIWLNLRAIVTGAPRVTAYRRTIAIGSIRRANAVVAISIFSYFVVCFLLLGFEPELPARDLLFEACSALFTVGSSLGITSQLSAPSEILLCVAMFLGRVGIVSLLIGVVRRSKAVDIQYPSDNIIIN